MIEQRVVRTYPDTSFFAIKELEELLRDGWSVVMCNTYRFSNGTKEHQANEYILERNVEE